LRQAPAGGKFVAQSSVSFSVVVSIVVLAVYLLCLLSTLGTRVQPFPEKWHPEPARGGRSWSLAIGVMAVVTLLIVDERDPGRHRPHRQEVFLVLMATFVASILIVDDKSAWFTGVPLIAVHLVMAVTCSRSPMRIPFPVHMEALKGFLLL